MCAIDGCVVVKMRSGVVLARSRTLHLYINCPGFSPFLLIFFVDVIPAEQHGGGAFFRGSS